jgi:hypothetical protein
MKRRIAVHEDYTQAEHVEGSSNRDFGLVFAGVGAVVGSWWLWHGRPGAVWWLAAGFVFAALALLRPDWLAPLNRAWTRLGLVLFHIVNPVVLGILYFLVVTPVAYMMRLAGHRSFRMRPEPCETYWVKRDPPGPAPETIRNQF